MIIELHFHNYSRPVERREIKCTELHAPNVLKDREGNFFLKCPVDPRIAVGKPNAPLPYLQCRGEELSNLEIVRSPEAHAS